MIIIFSDMNIWNRVAASDKLLNLVVIYYTFAVIAFACECEYVITVMQYNKLSS